MTVSDKQALMRLVGGKKSDGVSTDDLQGLLLQVVFALLMIFMIAYFIFVASAKKREEEQVLDLNRQKLVLALEKTSEDHRVKYGLNALMTQGTDGRRTFDPETYVKTDRLEFPPAAKAAFASGSAAAFADYGDRAALAASWHTNVLAAAGLPRETLTPDELEWLAQEIAARMEAVRLDARGVQRALAARLQEELVAHPESFGDIREATALAAAIKAKSLDMVREALGTEVLP
ncbi:MAG: hypothetical protein ACI4R9_00195 [Kiritimatiellia bacterium]